MEDDVSWVYGGIGGILLVRTDLGFIYGAAKLGAAFGVFVFTLALLEMRNC